MSGGGGSSGGINYPDYMKNIHSHWLTHNTLTVGSDSMTYSVSDLMETAHNNATPYAGKTATDPDAVFLENAISTYKGPYELLEDFYSWDVDTAYTTYSTDTAVNDLTDAITDSLTDVYNERIIPDFASGLANINATMSSAYSIGQSNIKSAMTREIAKQDGQIRTGTVLQRLGIKMEWNRVISVLASENSRLYLAAKHEEQESNLDYSAKDAMWDLEIYQYGFRAMAAIAGTANPSVPSNKPSALGAAVSGAATGALIGAQVGGAPGAAIGAGIGGAVGLASTL